MGSVNDRGSIKWTAMMMPEHIEMLKDLKKEQSKVQRPIMISRNKK